MPLFGCCREEQEKLNVWVAYLNLENMFGSPDTLKAVFGRALQQNEPIKVSQQLINIYTQSEQLEVGGGFHSSACGLGMGACP